MVKLNLSSEYGEFGGLLNKEMDTETALKLMEITSYINGYDEFDFKYRNVSFSHKIFGCIERPIRKLYATLRCNREAFSISVELPFGNNYNHLDIYCLLDNIVFNIIKNYFNEKEIVINKEEIK